MKIERTAIYNIYGISSSEKKILYNALHTYRRGFGEKDQVYQDITSLMKKLKPTDDAPLMNGEDTMKAIASAFALNNEPEDYPRSSDE